MRVGWAVFAVVSAVAIPTQSAPLSLAAVASAPRAQVDASAQERSDGQVRVVATTNGKRVVVRYRLEGSAHALTRTARRKTVRVVLPADSRRIAVRAQATARLATSRWERVVVQPYRPAGGDPTPDPTDPDTGPGNGTDPGAPPTDPTADDGDPAPEPTTLGDGSAAVTDSQLAAAARTSVLFGHQSVGANILDGVDGLYENRGLVPPRITEGPVADGAISHLAIGENGDPRGKISHFADVVRSAGGVRVALMKLCYVDIHDGTDVDAVFDQYRATMAELSRQRPDITFVYTTVPLTVGAGADNAARQRYNAKIRSQYAATGRLFDIAAVASTRPDGTRTTAGSGSYLTLNPNYASDGDGHLNGAGSRRAAAALMRIVAAAIG